MMHTLPFKNKKVILQAAPIFTHNQPLLNEINAIWKSEQTKHNNRLFNGKIFSVDKITDNEIIGHITEYKFFLAQKMKPALFKSLHIQPLAVSGLTECFDGYVFGLRGSTTQDEGRWELVPSGSIDCAQDHQTNNLYQNQILVELQEEIGIAQKYIQDLKPFILVIDPKDHIFDIGIHIRLNCDFSTIEKNYQQCKNNEYTKLVVTPKNKLTQFIENNDVIPASLLLIHITTMQQV